MKTIFPGTLRPVILKALLFLIFIVYAHTDPVNIKILYVSNLPDIETGENRGGLAELGTLVKQYRNSDDNFIFLHGGDSLAPSIMSSFDYGTHMIDILNSILPEVMAVDEREFAYSEDQLILRISEAGFPIISSNTIDTITKKPLEGMKRHKIFSIGSYKIGVFSILAEEVRESYLAKRIFVNSNPVFIEEEARMIREEGADIIILLTGEDITNTEKLLNEGLVDIILKSETENDRIIPLKKGFFAHHGSSDGNCLLLNIEAERKGDVTEVDTTGTFVLLNTYGPDREIQEKIDYYLGTLNKIMSAVSGTTSLPLNTKRDKVRTEENAFGNFVADSMRDYYNTDIAVINGGSIRGNRYYKPGTDFTRKIIQGELPFYNKVIPVYVSGRQILQMLEHGFSRIEEINGGFLQVSGMKVKYSPDSEKGNRVISVTIGGKPLEQKKAYTLSVLDYMKKGGDGFEMLKSAEVIENMKEPLNSWEVLRLYIEKKQIIKPVIEGRLKRK